MLTRLFPIRIVESVHVKFSLIFNESFAKKLPDSAAFFRRIAFEALNAISVPEKNADRMIMGMMIRI
jgi:hypothetical protein